MAQTLVQNVADTAFWVAYYRAEESDRPDALFKDPLARSLAGERGREIARSMPGAKMTRWQTSVRTRIIDDYIRELVREGAVDTVLNLGAGLDTRPYRMDLPATLRWVEIDQAGVIDFKTQHLERERPRCVLERRAVDLADTNERRAALKQVCAPGSRVLALTEGVVPYLANADVAALAKDLREQPGIVGWIAEYFSEQVLRFRAKRMGRVMASAPFQFHPPEWFAFFEASGWRAKETRYLPVEGQRLGRPFPAPFMVRVLVRATRLLRRRSLDGGFFKTMGYVLYEPSAPIAGA